MRILLFFIALLPFTISAQNDPFEPEWSFGANGGVTLSNISFNPSIRQSTFLQSVVGATARYISEKQWGLQVELNYSQRGWNEYHPDSTSIKYNRSLGYLEIPVCTHLYFDLSKRFRLVFNMGPQIGILLGEKEQASGIPEEHESYYDTKAQRSFDWGICGGGGLEFRAGRGSFLLEGRYYFGLSDVFNNSRADVFAASPNKVTNIKFSYLIRIN